MKKVNLWYGNGILITILNFFWVIVGGVWLAAGSAIAGDYLNSSHGNSTAGVNRSTIDPKFSVYSIGNCAHCHEQHASILGAEPEPVGGAKGYLGFAFEENLCLECHDANGPASTNIAGEYDKTRMHGYPNLLTTITGVHTAKENTDVAFSFSTNKHAECTDCHNPHMATATPATNDPSKGPIIGASGVDVTNSTAGANPAYTFVTNVTDSNQQYKVCFKCHSSWSQGISDDTAKAFNPANDSFHWVESDKLATYVPNTGTGKGIFNTAQFNLTYAPIMMPRPSFSYTNANLRTLSLRCSDCHGTDNASATTIEGPHGNNFATTTSTISINILKVPAGSPYNSWNTNSYINDNQTNGSNIWCFNCHDPSFTGTGFRESGSNGDILHLRQHTGNAVEGRCQSCHLANPHGQVASGTSAQRQHLLKPTTFTDAIDSLTSGSYTQGTGHSATILNCT